MLSDILDPPPTPLLAGVNRTARVIGIPIHWLKAEAKAGRVPHLLAGKTFLFNVEAVREFLARRAAEMPTAEPLAVRPAEPSTAIDGGPSHDE